MGTQLLTSFSCYKNTKKLLDTSGSKRPELIPCLDGIRFLSMTWVVAFHTYDFSTTSVQYTASNKNDLYYASHYCKSVIRKYNFQTSNLMCAAH